MAWVFLWKYLALSIFLPVSLAVPEINLDLGYSSPISK